MFGYSQVSQAVFYYITGIQTRIPRCDQVNTHVMRVTTIDPQTSHVLRQLGGAFWEDSSVPLDLYSTKNFTKFKSAIEMKPGDFPWRWPVSLELASSLFVPVVVLNSGYRWELIILTNQRIQA